MPNFFDGLELDDPDLTDKWNQAERVWLESLGWASITLNVEGGYFEKHFSKGFLIVSGQSVRGLSHAVVYKDGELWHDPFPGGQGVSVVREVEVVYPLRPFALLDSQSQLTAAREEWETKIGELVRVSKDVGFNDAGYGYNPSKRETEAEADEQKAATLDSIMSLQSQLTAAREEVERMSRLDVNRLFTDIDKHNFSTRPCSTCTAISAVTGNLFGCVKLRQEANEKARQPK